MIAACLSFTARNRAQPDRLEIDEAHAPLLKQRVKADLVPTGHDPTLPDSEVRHKLRCMAAVRQWEGKEDGRAAKITVRSIARLEPMGGLKIAACLWSFVCWAHADIRTTAFIPAV